MRCSSVAEPPSPAFVEALRARGVGPISVGQTIVATWEPHEKTVLEVIRDQGLELQVIFNKGAVMILPSGVNKASGLKAKGLTVPGMPAGSPGMEVGGRKDAYNVMLIDRNGRATVYAKR